MQPKLIFQNITKIDKSLARLSQKKKEKTQITKIWNESGDITIYSTEIKRIRRVLWTILCQQIDNLDEMDQFLDTQNLQRMNHKEKTWINL